MARAIDKVILTDGNREAFEKVIHIDDVDESGKPITSEPIRMFIYGPRESGKTTLASTKAHEKDGLFAQRIVFSHGAEIMFYLKQAGQMEHADEFLGNVGEAEILFLDAFEAFFDGINEEGPQIPGYLLASRDKAGLSTVVFSNVPLSELPKEYVSGVFDEYEKLTVECLDDEGRMELARRAVDKIRHPETKQLTDEALAFVALEFTKTVSEIDKALTFLLTVADFPDDAVIDVDAAKQALGA